MLGHFSNIATIYNLLDNIHAQAQILDIKPITPIGGVTLEKVNMAGSVIIDGIETLQYIYEDGIVTINGQIKCFDDLVDELKSIDMILQAREVANG